MSAEPEQAMKRANATDSAEYQLAALHARDYQERLERKHPARWRMLKFNSPVAAVRVTADNREVTIRAMVAMTPPLLRKSPVLRDRWHFTGWGVMVREAGIYTRSEPL